MTDTIPDPVPGLSTALRTMDGYGYGGPQWLVADPSMRPVFRTHKILPRLRKLGHRVNVVYRDTVSVGKIVTVPVRRSGA